MPLMIVVLTLFAVLMAADADAETDAERLAEMFSPVLILTEETGHKWGDVVDCAERVGCLEGVVEQS